MKIKLLLIEGGAWWHVDVYNADNLKEILNTGHWQGTKLVAVLIDQQNNPMIYDFIIKQWR